MRSGSGTSRLDVTSKNTTLFPAFSEAVRADLMQELPRFLDYVLFQGDHKLGTLLTSPQGYVTAALAPIYGVSAPSGGPAVAQLPDSQARSGILTQAAFLSVQAHPTRRRPCCAASSCARSCSARRRRRRPTT